MSLWSSFKSLFTKKQETQTTQTIAPTTKGVVVTDFSSGESVKTESSGGTVSKQTYTPAPSSSSSSRSGGGSGGGGASQQLGEQKALELANREGGLVSQSFNQPQAQEKTSGSTIQPATQSSVSAVSYTGETPQRYNRPLGSALKESFTNVFNFGIIGRQGLGSYFNQVFYEPFEYVGTPKAYSTAPNFALQNWQGTEFGYGLPESEKNKYRPEQFQTKTYFQLGEEKAAALYEEAGLNYKGEPVSLIPFRVGEQVTSQLKPKYEAQLNTEIEGLRNQYQEKVNTGALSVDEATKQFKTDVEIRTGSINTQFQTEASSIYEQRIGSIPTLNKKIREVQDYRTSIFEPPAYPIIRTAGRVIETGAIIGATAFGGSGVTLAASAYLGYKTESQAVQYVGAFNQLSTKQKILGGAGIAAGAAATYYTFNLGVTKFYSEWRGIIYEDLAKSSAKIRGQEVLRTEEFSRYEIASLRQSGVNKALTVSRTDVYQTGTDRVGFFTKGATRTTIYDPQYEKYISTTQKFTSSGYIPDIKEGVSFASRGVKITPEGYFGGLGNAKVITGENVRDIKFIAASKDQGEFYRVAGGANPQRAFSGQAGGINYYSTAVRGRFDSAGIIAKLQDQGVSNLVIVSGKKSSQAYFNNLYNVGGAATAQVTKQIQSFTLKDLSSTVAPSATKAVAAQASRQVVQFKFSSPSQQTDYTQNQQIGYSLPALNQLLPQQSEERQSFAYANNSVLASLSEASQRSGFIPAQATSPALATITRQGLKLRTGQLNPLTPSFPTDFLPPDIPRGNGGGFYFDLGGLDIGLPSTIIKGGSRKTGYTPSFSALVFNLRGAYSGGTLSKSGIDFRPITKGFSFNTGLGGFGALRKILKRK